MRERVPTENTSEKHAAKKIFVFRTVLVFTPRMVHIVKVRYVENVQSITVCILAYKNVLDVRSVILNRHPSARDVPCTDNHTDERPVVITCKIVPDWLEYVVTIQTPYSLVLLNGEIKEEPIPSVRTQTYITRSKT